MYLNNKIEQLKHYFSEDRLDKVKKLLQNPITPCMVIAVTGSIMLFVVNPWYVNKVQYEKLAKPLIQVQHERFQQEAAELGIEYNVTLEERLEEFKKYMRER